MVEQSPHHPNVKGSNPAMPLAQGERKMAK
jgi:hypothetical protein